MPLMLLVPFVTFLKHHGYPLARAEVILCLGVLATIGLIGGAVAAAAPVAIRLAVLWLGFAAFVDIQLTNPRHPAALAILLLAIPVFILFRAG